MLSGSLDRTMILWDMETRTVIRRFLGNNAGIFSVAFSPDGRLALSGSQDGDVRLWDVNQGTLLRRFIGHNGPVSDVAFSRDGKIAVSASDDQTVRLWRIDASQEELLTWIEDNRFVPELTCAQRERYQVEPLCETQ